ncbi:MAG: DMT family transporter [Dehalococcoidia bacterium]|nr:DMT family transporter [Dehalococcoidia bacterium]
MESRAHIHRAQRYAFLAAIGFGLSVPLSKHLVDDNDAFLIAGLLYWGVAAVFLPLLAVRAAASRSAPVSVPRLRRADVPWLAISLGVGGIGAPVLLLLGLQHSPASTASLLLTLEGACTIALAGLVFRERLSPAIIVGGAIIAASGALLAVRESGGWGVSLGALAVAGATACWALDNNLTRKISANDPFILAATRGVVAGTVNCGIAVALGTRWPSWEITVTALAVGAVSYGISLYFFILALRGIGAARTGAIFGAAPFIGAAVAAAMYPESRSWVLLPAGTAMAIGGWVLLRESGASRRKG